MRILLVQLRRLGDILLTTPALAYLKKIFPQAEIDFLSEKEGKPILSENPYLREIIIYDKKRSFEQIRKIRRRRYDVVFDFMNNPRTRLLTAFSGARWRVGYHKGLRSFFYNMPLVSKAPVEYVAKRKIRLVQEWLQKTNQLVPEPDSYRPQFFTQSNEDGFAKKWLKDENQAPGAFVIMVPKHRHEIRQWRREGFLQVGLELVKKNDVSVYLAWGPGEESIVDDLEKKSKGILKALPSTTFGQMAAILREAKFVVTNDSGAMHLSVAMKTPTITIYGPTRPLDWNPSFLEPEGTSQDKVVTASGLFCLGCHLSHCPIGHLCMKNVTSEEVLEACNPILERSKNLTYEKEFS